MTTFKSSLTKRDFFRPYVILSLTQFLFQFTLLNAKVAVPTIGLMRQNMRFSLPPNRIQFELGSVKS